MADFAEKSTLKGKKRKTGTLEDKHHRLLKAHRVARSQEESDEPKVAKREETVSNPSTLEEAGPWRNLQLIMSIRNKELDITTKVQLAYNFIKSRRNEVDSETGQDSEAVSISRVVVFLNDWVQSLLISSEKKNNIVDRKPISETTGTCLDFRCWEIFRFLLNESVKLDISLNFSRNLLKAISNVSGNALSLLNDTSLHSKETFFVGEEYELYGIMLDCVSLVFLTTHGSVLNENLELWISTIGAVLGLALKVYIEKLDNGNVGLFVNQLSYLVLQSFSKFLKVHPCRKNGFQAFIDKLLEPLLHILSLLRVHTDGDNSESTHNLLNLAEEVLSQGLFHTIHIDGFLSLRSTEKYAMSLDGKSRDSKAIIKSYHRHLFDKLEKIITSNKLSVLAGLGELFHQLVHRVKSPKGFSMPSEDTMMITKPGASSSSSSSTTEIQKSLFDFFVQIMEPLLVKISKFPTKVEIGPHLLDVHGTLKAINNILTIFMDKKIYVRTDDNSDGGCFNFLKKAFDVITTIPIKLNQLFMLTCDTDKRIFAATLNLISKELIVSIGYFLEIEYKVLENGLVNIWLMLFSFLDFGQYMVEETDQCSLNSLLIKLGCQLIHLYSDLRQVNNIIIALCKAVRIYVSPNHNPEINLSSKPLAYAPLSSIAYAKSLGNVICSREFRHVIYNTVKSIPEGQASGCIKEITMDFSESLQWIIASNSESIEIEVLGRCLSEIYILVLESLTVTAGNSTLVVNSIEDLMTAMRPSFGILVNIHPNNVSEFLSFILGTSKNNTNEGKPNLTHWIFLFFFRLYMSCKSLNQQAINMLPPESSLKMVYTGRDWMENSRRKDEGYFSWIIKPSNSLLVIIDSISDIYVKENVGEGWALLYVLIAMAMQRLVDLNLQIESFEYLLHHDKNLSNMAVVDEADVASNLRKCKKWEKRLSILKQEASGLTEFMMRFLSLVAQKQQLGYYGENGGWDLNVCGLDETSFPIAFWWILCQNTDIWGSHTSKKELKRFLSILIRSCLPCIEDIKENINRPNKLRVTVQKISSQFLSDTILYEQRFARRYFATVFCRILQESVVSFFDFSVLPNWSEVISSLDNLSMVVSDDKNATGDYSSMVKRNSHFSNMPHSLTSTEIRDCHNLLNLLCWMPKDYFNFKSFSRFGSVILNLERLVVSNLLDCHGALHTQQHCELLRLFVSCRRALKSLMTSFCEEREKTKSLFTLLSALFEDSSIILWLLSSVSSIISLQHAFLEDNISLSKNLIHSLMDHTSYVCLTLSQDQVQVALQKINNSSDDDFCAEDIDIWKSVVLDAETLKEHTKSSLISLKIDFVDVINVNKSSSLLACIQGFLWGITSALNDIDTNPNDDKPKLSISKILPISKLKPCIKMFEDFISFLLCTLLFKDDKWPEILSEAQDLPKSAKKSDSTTNILTEVDFSKLNCLEVLQNLLNGNNLEAAFLLRQLFVASSAIIRLNLQMNRTPFQSTLVSIFISISRVLLSELSSSVEVPPPLSIICLDGVLKYLEEVGKQFSLIDSNLTRNLYTKLIDLHLRAIGKCISLQGIRATLLSHDRESSTKTLECNKSEDSFSNAPSLDELKNRLRMSFKVFVSKPSELHLLSALQAIERALVGAKEDCTTTYEVSMGNATNWGQASSIVAAGIDCLDLLLEFVSGRKRLSVVKRHIQNLIAGLFNIILHLQSPLIFYEKNIPNKGNAEPNPGSVILMCIEVLTKISGKHALFQMDTCQIAQCLRAPAALFQDFHRLKFSEALVVDRRFSVDLFAACCRLLYTVLKHHKIDCEKCLALLEVSVSVLLQCLETVEADSSNRNGYFSLEIQEGVKCASFLRRIYEEIRHQKDVFKGYGFQFLSRYIWIYAGFGPLKTGIRREIDEALRPGVYALIDLCSADDFQHLHTVFGEGSCRSTLVTLEHDYKLNFQYGGKV